MTTYTKTQTLKRYEFWATKGAHTYVVVTDNKVEFTIKEWEARMSGYTTKCFIFEP